MSNGYTHKRKMRQLAAKRYNEKHFSRKELNKNASINPVRYPNVIEKRIPKATTTLINLRSS